LSSDHLVFKRGDGAQRIVVTVYVDDLVIAGPSLEEVNNTKAQFSSVFRMVDLGELKYLLGIEILRDEQGNIKMSQQTYAEAILEKFGMKDCKPVEVPLQKKTQRRSGERGEVEYPYREVVGSLMYLMLGTRPDLAAAVSYASRYLGDPGKEEIDGVKRILRYVRGTTDYCLQFRQGPVELVGYVDADWGGCLDSRRSTSGYVFLLAGAAISWKSKKQEAVALSSTEAEYMGACLATKEAIWLRTLMEELGVAMEKPTVIYSDNQSSLKLMENPVLHERTKHIDIQFHFTRDSIDAGQVTFKFIRTDKQAADSLTKGVAEAKTKFCAHMFGLVRRG